MAPKRSKKRAAVDDEDITPLLPESTQMEAARPAKKKKSALPQNPPDETDEHPEPPRRTLRSAAQKTQKTIIEEKQSEDDDQLSKEEPAQSGGKTLTAKDKDGKTKIRREGGRTVVQNPANPRRQRRQDTKKGPSRQGSGISKRTMSNQSSSDKFEAADQVYADSVLAQLRAQEKQIKKLNVTTIREVGNTRPARAQTTPQDAPETAPPSAPPYLVDQLFSGPAVSGREWTCEMEEYTASNPSLAKKWRPKPRVLFWLVDGTGKSEEKRLFGHALISHIDTASASRITPDIASAVNRYPGSVEDMSLATMPNKLWVHYGAALIIEAAIQRQGRRRVLPAPSFKSMSTHGTSPRYEIVWRVSCYDPKTNQPWVYTGRVNAIQVESTSAPYTPNVQFKVKGRSEDETPVPVHQDSNGRDVHESLVPDPVPDLGTEWKSSVSKRQACLNPEALARALVAQLHGLKVDKPSLVSLIKFYSAKFGRAAVQKGPRSVGSNIYGGDNLFKPYRNLAQQNFTVRPSKAVVKDIDRTSGRGALPSITIASIDRNRVIPALDALTETWLRTGDILAAWLALAKAAFKVNQDIDNGVLARPGCRRGESEESCDSSHVCGSCGRAFLCSEMVDGVLGLRVRRRCDVKDVKSNPLGLSYAVARRSLRSLIVQEQKAAGMKLSDKKVSDLYQQALQQLEAIFKESVVPGATYVDGYSGQEQTLPAKPSGYRKKAALGLSIDAAFPYAMGPTGVRKHVKDNYVLCPLAVNFAKHTHLPALLSWLSHHLAVYDAHQAGDLQDDDWSTHLEHMVEVAKQLSALRSKAEHQFIYRRSHPASDERFALDRYEWRAGKFHGFDGSEREDQPWHTQRTRMHKRSWQSLNLRSTSGLVQKIQREFGVDLPKGDIDADCPWFCYDNPPPDWSWKMCNNMAGSIFQRFSEDCNGDDDTVDTPECIYIEIIFIVCTWKWKDKGKDAESGKFWSYEQKLGFRKRYSEFLNLPIVSATKNPICFAVTHETHGHAMRTAWQENPTELEHRKDSLNNMLLETQTSNYAKHNFEFKEYAAIRSLFRNFKQGKLGPDVAAYQQEGLFGQWYDSTLPQLEEVDEELHDRLFEVDEAEVDALPNLLPDASLPVDFDDKGSDAGSDEEDDGKGGGEDNDDEDNGDEQTIADLRRDFSATYEWVSTARAKHTRTRIVMTFLADMQEAVETPDREVYDQTKEQMLEWIKQNAPA